MTLQELIDAVTAKLRQLGAAESVEINQVAGVTRDVKNDNGEIVGQATTYWNPLMPTTKENVSRKWIELLKEKDGIDASGSDFLLLGESSMSFGLENTESEAMV